MVLRFAFFALFVGFVHGLSDSTSSMDQSCESLQITTWNALNPAFENENWYAKGAIRYLHWNKGRKTSYVPASVTHC
jgi:hypothetical protein